MAQIPVTRFSVEDFPGAEEWFGDFLTMLNQNTSAISLTLNRGVTLRENLACKRHEVTFTTHATYVADAKFSSALKFTHGLSEAPFEVRLAKIFKKSASTVPIGTIGVPHWHELAGVVHVTYIPGLANSTEYVARFVAQV